LNNQQKPYYNFDVNSTTKCNLRCTYCIEHEWFKKPEMKQTDETMKTLVEKVDALLASKRFTDKHDGIGFNFWGGEPTTNPKFIIDMVEYYKNEPRVRFFIYSNGFNIGKIKDLLLKYKHHKSSDNKSKIIIQVSYDGKASHNIARVDVAGNGSADKVKETLTWLRDNDMDYSIKATIGFYDLDHLYENYMEFLQMDRDGYRCNTYGPTIDYLSDYDFTPIEMAGFKKSLKEQVFKMAKEEIAYYNWKQGCC